MSTNQTTHFDTKREFEIKPQAAGGFIIRQHYFNDEKDGNDDRIYNEFQRAFSHSSDVLSFLDEAYGYTYRPLAISTQLDYPKPIQFITTEGGTWYNFKEHWAPGDPVFAVKFSDNSILDLKTGSWRVP